MNSVECPRCTLHFEPEEEPSVPTEQFFCPQCGHEFPVEVQPETTARTAAAY
jgi:hypothetical protein